MALTCDACDSCSSDDSPVAELGQDDELPAGLDSGMGLTHECLEEFVENDPAERCKEYIADVGNET